jgi:succinate dehydrogenase / fumarate reductase, membrane anchor subunit
MREHLTTRDMVADPKSRYGNGRSATRHFLTQRVTGAINIVFLGFLLFIVVRLAGQDRVDVVSLLGNAWVGIPFAVLFAIAAVHMRIGMREVIEDYVHEPGLNRLSLSLNTFAVLLIGAVGVRSILKLVFWG